MQVNKSNQCPECYKSLRPYSKVCGCGWKAKAIEDRQEMIADHHCQYQRLGRRCLLPGSVSSSTRGSTWYCSEHQQNLANPEVCEKILLNAEKNYEQIMEDRIGWRDRLYPEDFNKEKSKIRRPYE